MFKDFGIMQGRLVLPHNGELQCFPDKFWKSEFFIAQSIGIEFIELMIDEDFNDKNPLLYENGYKDINIVNSKTNQKLYSICFNYMITHSILKNKRTLELLYSLISLIDKVNYKMIVLPFYSSSCMTNENINIYRDVLLQIGNICKSKNILLSIESDVDAKILSSFIDTLDNEIIGVVYDTGNRIVNQVDLYNEIILLGDKIFHVHIKDKNKLNENVLIGTGLVDFYSVFSALKDVNYSGKFVFESQRGTVPSKTAYNQAMYIQFIKDEIK